MLHHTTVPEVQRCCCYALGNLAWANATHKRSFVDANALDPIMVAFAQHMDNADVIEQVCYVIGILTANDDHNKARAADAGVIDAIIAALGRYSTQRCPWTLF
jgi:hypothetical protein